MKEKLFAAGLLAGLALAPTTEAAPASLRLLTQNNYLPGLPVLVRVEGYAPDGSRDHETWDIDATLTADGGVALSTNKNHTLTIESNTLVLIDGVGSGTAAADNFVQANASIQSLGTELHPVMITCSNLFFTNRWGQIRHVSSQPSLYRHTFIHRAGRGVGEGHTGQAAAIRPSGSTLTFESCSITDLAQTTDRAQSAYGAPAKVMFVSSPAPTRARRGARMPSTTVRGPAGRDNSATGTAMKPRWSATARIQP